MNNLTNDVPTDGGYGGIIQGWKSGGSNYRPLSSVNCGSDFFRQPQDISVSAVLERVKIWRHKINRVRKAFIFKNREHICCGYLMIKFIAFEAPQSPPTDFVSSDSGSETRASFDVLVCANPQCRLMKLLQRRSS